MNFSETVLAIFIGTFLAQATILAVTGKLRFRVHLDEQFEPVFVPQPDNVIDLREDEQYTRHQLYN